MTRFEVPASEGDTGGWFDLRPMSSLNADHMDDDDDIIDTLIARKRATFPPPGPDPANPAVMAPEPKVTLARRELGPRYGQLLGWILEASSYGLDAARFANAAAMPPGDARIDLLGSVFAEERRRLPLPAWNELRALLEPYFAVLNGQRPKGTSSPDGTTGLTSGTT